MADIQHASETVVLEAHELPAACPNPRMPLWSSHPKVYLDMSQGSARCPYCGTTYTLAEGVRAHGH